MENAPATAADPVERANLVAGRLGEIAEGGIGIVSGRPCSI
jgi:hypothetical protein